LADIFLHEAVCRQKPEMWPTVGYMKLCVDTDLEIGRHFLLEAVCRQRPELCPIVVSSVVTVFEVTERSVLITL